MLLDPCGATSDDWTTLVNIGQTVEASPNFDPETAAEQLLHALLPVFGVHRGVIVFTARTRHQGDAFSGFRPVWFHNTSPGVVTRVLKRAFRHLTWAERSEGQPFHEGVPRAMAASTADQAASHRAIAHVTNTHHRLSVWIPAHKTVEVALLLDRSAAAGPFSHLETARGVVAATVFTNIVRRWSRWLGLLDGALLTPRERQVLALLLAGCSEKEGASELGLRTSSFHQIVVTLYRKLGVSSRGELSAKCLAPATVTGELWAGRTIDIGL